MLGPVLRLLVKIENVLFADAIVDSGCPTNIISGAAARKIAATKRDADTEFWNRSVRFEEGVAPFRDYSGKRLQIRDYIRLTIEVGGKPLQTTFLIDPQGRQNVLLGTSLLSALGTNIILDYADQVISISDGKVTLPAVTVIKDGSNTTTAKSTTGAPLTSAQMKAMKYANAQKKKALEKGQKLAKLVNNTSMKNLTELKTNTQMPPRQALIPKHVATSTADGKKLKTSPRQQTRTYQTSKEERVMLEETLRKSSNTNRTASLPPQTTRSTPSSTTTAGARPASSHPMATRSRSRVSPKEIDDLTTDIHYLTIDNWQTHQSTGTAGSQ